MLVSKAPVQIQCRSGTYTPVSFLFLSELPLHFLYSLRLREEEIEEGVWGQGFGSENWGQFSPETSSEITAECRSTLIDSLWSVGWDFWCKLIALRRQLSHCCLWKTSLTWRVWDWPWDGSMERTRKMFLAGSKKKKNMNKIISELQATAEGWAMDFHFPLTIRKHSTLDPIPAHLSLHC